jgi:putative peptidoglycan lipid II flippase
MLAATFAAQVCLTLAGFEAAYLIWGLFAARFSVADAQATATLLGYLCLGLAGWAAQSVISRGFYALNSTWLPTTIGTAVAFTMVPMYVLLRQQWGAVGLAVSSAFAILVYVLLLGWLQRRRFDREARARGTILEAGPGMLDGALRLAAAAAVATAVGLGARVLLIAMMPGIALPIILLRAVILCSLGTAIYVMLAYWFGVRDLADIKTVLLRQFRRRQQ